MIGDPVYLNSWFYSITQHVITNYSLHLFVCLFFLMGFHSVAQVRLKFTMLSRLTLNSQQSSYFNLSIFSVLI